MYPIKLQLGIKLKKSPFLVIRQFETENTRVYSRLHGNLTLFDFKIEDVLNIFNIQIDLISAIKKVKYYYPVNTSLLIEELFEKRFLIDANINERDMLFEYIENVRTKYNLPKLTMINFLISARCNLACIGCYHNFFDFKSSNMENDFADQVLNGLFPYLKKCGTNALLISFFGYEPLSNFETLSRIHAQAGKMSREHDIKTSFRIFTNAFDLTDELYKWVEQNKSDLSFKVSLDGIKEDNDKRRVDVEGRGTYHMVIENSKRLISTGVECGIITVLSKLNSFNIEKFVDEMAAIGIKKITANIFCGHTMAERLLELSELGKFDAIKRMDLATDKYDMQFDGEWKYAVTQMFTGAQFYCPAGIRQLAFSADGLIYPCQRFAGTNLNFGEYRKGFWNDLAESRCISYNNWIDDLYNGVIERTNEKDTDLTGWSCPFLPFLRGECISTNFDRGLNEKLLEYYITRPLNRIISETPQNYISPSNHSSAIQK